MVDRQNRVKKKKFRKTPGGKTVIHRSRAQRAYAECAVSGAKLSGMGDQSRNVIRKLSSSARRPSVKFGGELSNTVRKEIWEHVALIKAGQKSFEESPAKLKPYISPQIKEKKE